MADTTTISVDFLIPNVLLVPSTVEAYATDKGWNKQVLDDKGNLINNPVAALDFIESWLRKFLADDYRNFFVRGIQEAALAQAKAQIDAILGSIQV